MKKLFILLLSLVFVFGLVSCVKPVNSEEVNKDAVYAADTELGEGDKTVYVAVVTGDKTVTFTVHTSEQFLGKALLDLRLIDGDQGDYGLYVKKVNGVVADYDVDQSYWSLSVAGEISMTGIDAVEVVDGTHYELTYTK